MRLRQPTLKYVLATTMLAATLLAPQAGCNNKKDQENLDAIMAAVYANAVGCGVMTEGEMPGYLHTFNYYEALNPESAASLRCLFNCYKVATCAQLEGYFCMTNEDLNAHCLPQCYDTFTCADGDVTVASFQCDGYVDCSDMSDEAGCPEFTCDNGDTTLANLVCDFREDCSDGSDEVACPGFVCGDGEVINPDYECDGDDDCNDALDEVGCTIPEIPQYQCSDGAVIIAERVCDGRDDCTDGSDELSCAEPICPAP